MKKLFVLFLLMSTPMLAQFILPIPYFPDESGSNHLSYSEAYAIFMAIVEDKSQNWYFVLYEAEVLNLHSHAVISSRADATATTVTPVVLGTLQTDFDPIYPVITPLYSYFAGGQAAYNALSPPLPAAQGGLSAVQPSAPPNTRIIAVDGYAAGLVAVDMTVLSVVSQVPALPASAGPVSVRPASANASSEVWAAELGGGQVVVANLNTQTLVATIATPSVPKFSTANGLVFTPDGATALEVLQFASTDSAGNNGVLVVFDAAGRSVKSTLLLKNLPTALLMAPDGATAYILNSNGMITYYDILSGTADLSVASVLPGSGFGYPGIGSSVGIHPDGTRIFWNVGTYLVIFDLTTHRITHQFNSGLPTTVNRIFSLSRDGGTAYFSDPLGDVASMSTYDGTVLATFNTGSGTAIFGGLPQVP